MKPRHLLSALAILLSLLAGWFAPPAHSFDERWPANMAPVLPLQMFNVARKASARQSFCIYHYPGAHVGADCRWS